MMALTRLGSKARQQGRLRRVDQGAPVSNRPDSIFDVRIKRSAARVQASAAQRLLPDLYFRMKDDPTLKISSNRVFIFGAKGCPRPIRAKAIIKLINAIGGLVNNDKDINSRIKVVFVTAQRLARRAHHSAADVSERISMAGRRPRARQHKFMMVVPHPGHPGPKANVEILRWRGPTPIFRRDRR